MLQATTLALFDNVINKVYVKCEGAKAIIQESYQALGDDCPFTKACLTIGEMTKLQDDKRGDGAPNEVKRDYLVCISEKRK